MLTMGKTWGKHGENIGKTWGKHGENMGTLKTYENIGRVYEVYADVDTG